jgi:phage host-nuclease inhibitor protein Gam
MAAEQAELQKKFERTMEEKDKVQEQSNYIYTQHSQLQAYAQKMNYDKEQVEKQLHRVRSEHDQKMSRLLDELNRARSDLECAIQDRDDYKYKVTELQRESQRLNEKVQSYSGIDYKSSRKEMDNLIEQNNHLRTSLKELKDQNENIKVRKKGEILKQLPHMEYTM